MEQAEPVCGGDAGERGGCCRSGYMAAEQAGAQRAGAQGHRAAPELVHADHGAHVGLAHVSCRGVGGPRRCGGVTTHVGCSTGRQW